MAGAAAFFAEGGGAAAAVTLTPASPDNTACRLDDEE